MSYAERIIAAMKGTRAAAAALGLPPSTVQSWKDTGLIPAKHQQAVLDICSREKFEIDGRIIGPADFFDTIPVVDVNQTDGPPPPSEERAA